MNQSINKTRYLVFKANRIVHTLGATVYKKQQPVGCSKTLLSLCSDQLVWLNKPSPRLVIP